MYTTDVYQMYTKYIQIYTTFSQTLVYIFYTKSKELCQQNFVYKMYAKCIQNFVEMWDTFCMQTFCIHFVYISSDL